MKNKINDFFKRKHMFTFWSSGKPFDPTYQERTSAIDDIIEAEEKKKKRKSIWKLFKGE